MNQLHQKLPGSGPQREALRQKGQFWTPDWVAEAMVSYVVAGGSDHVFDPAVGAGAFFRAAKAITDLSGKSFVLLGTEIDHNAIEQARQNGLKESDLAHIQIRDFVLDPPPSKFKAIVGNPPYIRHHRLPAQIKANLKKLSAQTLGTPLDGRAGLHVYFLLRALQLLKPGGRLAFIMPADTCEGVFSADLWRWITNNFRLEASVTFAPQASPFPGVDTNPIIFLIKNAKPTADFLWAQCLKPQTRQLRAWMSSDFEFKAEALTVHCRQLAEGLQTGLSRAPIEVRSSGSVLGDFAKVMRGIATGANEFFFLTGQQSAKLKIPEEFLIPAIGRTRDVCGDEINSETLLSLKKKGRPTLLFSPDGRAIDLFPDSVRQYLRRGEALELNQKSLIATRKPWYKMEVRPTPPILFAYLGRRNTRFILNSAKVVPLTGFLCIYPYRGDDEFTKKLWEALRHPETIANLSLVGKSYGNGAIKVEPRALERLLIPSIALLQSKLCDEPVLKDQSVKKPSLQPFLPLV